MRATRPEYPRHPHAEVLDRLFSLETLGVRLGLDNIARLCEGLGHPERAFTTIHVAGTNGKGSVTAMVHAALVSGGVRAARFTSPHLIDLNERFVVGTDPVDTPALEDLATHVLDRVAHLRTAGILTVMPTFFEVTTAMAFELFRRAGVEVAVIEVGLGGRFDATNVVTPPIGAITSIGLDHQEHLGRTIEAIASEKAGIIKPGMTVVLGAMPDAAVLTLRGIAGARGARVVAAGQDTIVDTTMADGRASVTITTPADRYGPLTLALRGEHQVGNALVAVRLLEAAREAGIVVSADAIEAGLSTVTWPARLEVITIGSQRLILDAAHNADGARALAAYLAQWQPERPALVLGVMRDKDLEAMLGALLPVTATVFATQAPTHRALPAADLAQRIRAAEPTRPVHAEPHAWGAVERALAEAQTVCVAGSIFLAGTVRDALKARAILR